MTGDDRGGEVAVAGACHEGLALATAEEIFFEAFVEYARFVRSSTLVAELLAAARALVERDVGGNADIQRVLGRCRSRAWRRFVAEC